MNDTTNQSPVKLCECGCGKPAPIAKGNHSKYGWIKGQPKRFVRGHRPGPSTEERFWSKVDKRTPDECWEWQSGRDSDGYGRFWHDGNTGGAHRFSYELHGGDLPDGHAVCHHCDNPPCVNPNHLFSGPNRVNSQDMVNKGRSLKGMRHNLAKLTRDNVKEIRERYAAGESQEKIAKDFGVVQTTVSRVILRQTWAHV